MRLNVGFSFYLKFLGVRSLSRAVLMPTLASPATKQAVVFPTQRDGAGAQHRKLLIAAWGVTQKNSQIDQHKYVY